MSGRWFGVTRRDTEACIVPHMFAASLGAPTIPVGSFLSSTIERDVVARSEIAV